MKLFLTLTLSTIILFAYHCIFAQNKSSYDGIEIKVSSLNSTTYYYGEQFNLYIEVTNTTNTPSKHWNLGYAGAYKMQIKDLGTGNTLKQKRNYSFYGASLLQREIMKKPPIGREGYAANEKRVMSIGITKDFGAANLTDIYLSGVSVSEDKLYAIPSGNYEIILEYTLYPADKKLTLTHSFQIVDLPASEKDAFAQYVKSTFYVVNAHYNAGDVKNYKYVVAHTDSYENFIKKHPNSIFAQYAMVDMFFKIYYSGGPNKEMGKYKEYLSYYPKITYSNIKAHYFFYLPWLLELYQSRSSIKIDTYKIVDDFLKKIIDEDLALSNMLIYRASSKHITGLKNYAEFKKEK